MTLPGTPSLIFLFYLLVFLPWAAFRSARTLRNADEDPGAAPRRRVLWISTLVSQVVLLTLAWLVGRGFGYEFLSWPQPAARHVGFALLALTGCFVLRWVSLAIRSSDERRRMAVYRWAPRARREGMLWAAVVIVASIAEEIAYRGVGMAILWYALGNPWIAALICAAAFALAHSTQGWKSAVIIAGVALIMHALVALTGTLILAMVVHAAYDLTVGYGISRMARRYDEEAAAA